MSEHESTKNSNSQLTETLNLLEDELNTIQSMKRAELLENIENNPDEQVKELKR